MVALCKLRELSGVERVEAFAGAKSTGREAAVPSV